MRPACLMGAIAILLAGCNLFQAGDPPTDVGPDSPDMAADAPDALFSPSDVGFGDTGDCVPEPEADGCTNNDVVCGPLTWTDNCGLQRAAICDLCDADSAVCDGVTMVCACRDGFMPGDVTRCLDIDECAEETDDCAVGTFCINVPGSFECNDCPAGQEKNATDVCVDIDECSDGSDDCDPLVTCTNLAPFFECGACPAGYLDENGDGTSCPDVDECAGDTDDCDVNATCRNQPGTFTCDCDPPYVGDGRTCTLVADALVAGVHHVSISLTEMTASVALPAGVADADMVVPFATAKPTGTTDDLQATIVDVWVDTQAGTVEVARGVGVGSVDVTVALVEFDQANVQTGTFAMVDAILDSVSLPTSFDPAKSFVVFGSMITNLPLTDYNPAMAAVDYDGQTLAFSRKIALGSTLEGHWYAVEAADDEFSVAIDQIEIGFGDRCASAPSSADFARTMVIAIGGSPAKQTGPLQNASMANIACGPVGGSIECCRGEPDPSTNAVAITLFSVEFDAASNGAVEHHSVAIPIGDTDEQQLLSSVVDPAWSMASQGTTGMIGAMKADEDLPMATMNAAFGSTTLVQNGAAIEARIAVSTTSVIEAWVQAITWPH